MEGAVVVISLSKLSTGSLALTRSAFQFRKDFSLRPSRCGNIKAQTVELFAHNLCSDNYRKAPRLFFLRRTSWARQRRPTEARREILRHLMPTPFPSMTIKNKCLILCHRLKRKMIYFIGNFSSSCSAPSGRVADWAFGWNFLIPLVGVERCASGKLLITRRSTSRWRVFGLSRPTLWVVSESLILGWSELRVCCQNFRLNCFGINICKFEVVKY